MVDEVQEKHFISDMFTVCLMLHDMLGKRFSVYRFLTFQPDPHSNAELHKDIRNFRNEMLKGNDALRMQGLETQRRITALETTLVKHMDQLQDSVRSHGLETQRRIKGLETTLLTRMDELSNKNMLSQLLGKLKTLLEDASTQAASNDNVERGIRKVREQCSIYSEHIFDDAKKVNAGHLALLSRVYNQILQLRLDSRFQNLNKEIALSRLSNELDRLEGKEITKDGSAELLSELEMQKTLLTLHGCLHEDSPPKLKRLDKLICILNKFQMHGVTLEGHTSRVSSVTADFEKMLAVSASADKTLRLWNLVSGRCTYFGHERAHRWGVRSVR
eukprot:TRINITY_DN15136_c0_g1_i1.p1 TRINITY_DN15136_c0_g1~~TRINITY_DN15136_c0_g1_i1.p1  ORF type:complete len:331 (+),score=57.51 TRINITY_DN15136_c0_g1_i1:266-1258(+)